MEYHASSLSSFTKYLKEALSDRITEFEKYMRSKGDIGIKSRRQWMYEYKKWTCEEGTVDAEIMKYLTES